MITKSCSQPWALMAILAILMGSGLSVPAQASREAFITPSPLATIEPASGPPEAAPAADHAPATAETHSEDTAAGHNVENPAAPGDTSEEGHGATAEGGHGEGGHGEGEKPKAKPKKNEGPPPLPPVQIGGRIVERAKAAEATAEAIVLPDALKGKLYPERLRQRTSFTPYAHSPRVGDPNAKLTVVIFEDLNCLSCTTASQGISAALKELITPPVPMAVAATSETTPTIASQVVWVYAPSSKFQGSNLPAFYGKIAARQGQFWPYREQLLQQPARTTEAAFTILSSLGLEPRLTRQIMLSEARRFYRELDGDTQQAKSLGIGSSPSVLVNGIRLGDHGLPLELLPDVLTYVRNRIHAGMNEPPL